MQNRKELKECCLYIDVNVYTFNSTTITNHHNNENFKNLNEVLPLEKENFN